MLVRPILLTSVTLLQAVTVIFLQYYLHLILSFVCFD